LKEDKKRKENNEIRELKPRKIGWQLITRSFTQTFSLQKEPTGHNKQGERTGHRHI